MERNVKFALMGDPHFEIVPNGDVLLEQFLQKAREEKGIKSADEAGLSQKEIARRKLAAARQRDAERYGDEFVDVTDDDVNVK